MGYDESWERYSAKRDLPEFGLSLYVGFGTDAEADGATPATATASILWAPLGENDWGEPDFFEETEAKRIAELFPEYTIDFPEIIPDGAG